MSATWIKVTDEISARFSHPCERDYGRGELEDICPEPYQGHGHILIQAPEGVGRIPFPCTTQEGLQEVLGFMVLRYDQEVYNDVARVLVDQDPDVKALPVPLSVEERSLLASFGPLQDATDINFVDEWS